MLTSLLYGIATDSSLQLTAILKGLGNSIENWFDLAMPYNYQPELATPLIDLHSIMTTMGMALRPPIFILSQDESQGTSTENFGWS